MFGQNLKRLRKAKGLSQSGLARSAGLTSVAISLLESGQRQPMLDTAEALAIALGCTLDDLRNPTPTPAPAPEPAAAAA
jgi:transcriptional regulator with XRE-family HTH domain